MDVCRNCRQPMEGFVAGEHDLCGVYCAVAVNAPIDGLDDGEICRHFIDELVDVIGDDLTRLQRGLAMLLFWLVEADAQRERGRLAGALETFLARTRGEP